MNEEGETGAVQNEAQADGPTLPVLTPIEARVLGCLFEKAVTTPEYYPLTLNALTNACNQKSNRDPVMTLSSEAVEQALGGLRHTHRLAALVHTAGSRTEKFKHTLGARFAVDNRQAAVLCELLLRGPETVGELRTRASRLHPFERLDEVQQALNELAAYADGPLVVSLAREPGRREVRWMHRLCGTPESSAVETTVSTPAEADDQSEEVRRLRADLDALRAEHDALKAAFNELKQQFE